MIVLCVVFLVIGIGIGYYIGFARGEKVIPESMMGIINDKQKEVADEVIRKMNKK